MKVAITGVEGLLGQEMKQQLIEDGQQVFGFSSRDLDITQYAQGLQVLQECQADIIINCAAYTQVEEAEEDEKKAWQVNALGVRNLSLIARDLSRVLVHFSSEYVFDGKKRSPYWIFDKERPINTYGYSKYLGEKFLLSLAPRFFLLRSSWFFGPGRKNFVEQILKKAQEEDSLAVVEDEWGSPTSVQDLAGAVVQLIKTPFFGLYHVTNQGYTSRFHFAQTICQLAGLKTPIHPITATAWKSRVQRPKNGRLHPFPLEETLGELLPPWEEALERYLYQKLRGS